MEKTMQLVIWSKKDFSQQERGQGVTAEFKETRTS